MATNTLTLFSGLMFWIFVLGTIGNWWRLIRAWVGKRKGSGLPLIPGILGAIALLIAPAQSELSRWHSYWWTPLLVDVGCAAWLVYFIWFSIAKRNSQHGNPPH